MKHFQKLSDDELLKEKNRYNDIVNKYQEPIDNYDIHYKNYLEAKRNGDELITWDHHSNTGNPIICSTPLITKQTANGSYYIKGFGEEHFETIKESAAADNNGIYILTKEGNKIVYTQKMELFVRRKRQIELILRGRKKDKEKTENIGHVYVFSNKSLPPNTYKIGFTYGDVDERAENLTGTGHLTPFKVEAKIKIKSAEYYEKKIHSLLKNYRVIKNKEFFEIDLNKIKNCLKQVSEISEKGSKKITLTDLKKEINL